MPSVQVKRGTKAQVDAAATANQLKSGELYLLTDKSLLAVGTGANTYFLTQKVNVVTNFSDLPAANSVVAYQERYFVTNVGVGGSEWYSNGTRWRPVGGQVTLYSSGSLTAAFGASPANGTGVDAVTLSNLWGAWAGVGDIVSVDLAYSRPATNSFYWLLYIGSVVVAGTGSDGAAANSNVAAATNFGFRILSDTSTIRTTPTLANSISGDGQTTNSISAITTTPSISAGADLKLRAVANGAGNSGGTININNFVVTLKACG